MQVPELNFHSGEGHDKVVHVHQLERQEGVMLVQYTLGCSCGFSEAKSGVAMHEAE
jgi:hypothetical protein